VLPQPVCAYLSAARNTPHGRASHGVYFINGHLTGVHLTGVYLMGVYLMGVDLIDVYFMDVYMFPNSKRPWKNLRIPHLTNGGRLSRSEFVKDFGAKR